MPPSRRSTTGEASSMDKAISPFSSDQSSLPSAKASCGPHGTDPIRTSISDPSSDPATPASPPTARQNRKGDALTVTPSADDSSEGGSAADPATTPPREEKQVSAAGSGPRCTVPKPAPSLPRWRRQPVRCILYRGLTCKGGTVESFGTLCPIAQATSPFGQCRRETYRYYGDCPPVACGSRTSAMDSPIPKDVDPNRISNHPRKQAAPCSAPSP